MKSLKQMLYHNNSVKCLKLFILLCVFIYSENSYSLDPEKKITQHIIRQWQFGSNTPRHSPYTIIEDANNTLWVGTFDGLFSFSGNSTTLYNSINTPEISHDRIRCLALDKNSTLWIGTSGGLVKFENKVFSKIDLSSHFTKGNSIRHIFCDNTNTLWVGSFRNGLLKIKNDEILHYTTENGLSSNYITCIYQSKDNTVWIGTQDAGICYIESGSTQINYLNKSNGLNSNYIKSLQEDKEGCLWVGMSKGLSVIKNKSVISLIDTKVFDNQIVYTLLLDSDGNIWAGSSDSCWKIRNNTVEKMLNHADTYKLYEDSEKSIWMGVYGGKLFQLRDGPVTVFSEKEGLSAKEIMSIDQDSEGAIWVATYGGGINVINENTPKHIPIVKNKTERLRTLINLDNDTVLYSSHAPGGFWKYNKKSQHSSKIPFPDSYIQVMEKDHTGNLWLGCNNALIKYSNGKILKEHRKSIDFPFTSITAIKEDSKGNIWIGTRGEGLGFLSGNITRIFTQKNGMPSDYVLSIFIDSEDTVWAGTLQGGLVVLKTNNLTIINAHNGLKSNTISQIIEDDSNNLWLGTFDGISRIAKSQLNAFIDGSIETIEVINYSLNDGMRTPECSVGYNPSVLKTEKGELYFCTVDGIAKINLKKPDKFISEKAPEITSVFVDDREIDSGKDITLDYTNKSIEFTFDTTSHITPEQWTFRYQLAGFHNTWIEASRGNNATYTNLDPGEYIFTLQAGIDNTWLESKTQRIKITVVPALWEKRWFQILIFIVCVLFFNILLQKLKQSFSSYKFWKRSTTFGNYRAVRILGKGGMGTVYEGIHKNSRQKAAVKVIHPNHLKSDSFQRFLQEKTIFESVNHPNIVKIHDMGTQKEFLFYIMEYLNGSTLREIMDKKLLDISSSLEIFRTLVDVIEYLKNIGVAHRDLKPENIMFSSDFTHIKNHTHEGKLKHIRLNMKVLDFGLAKIMGSKTMTETGMIAGTMYYLPPESFDGNRIKQEIIDIYSAGIILYEMITHTHPFEADDMASLMYSILNYTPTPPSRFNSDISDEFSQFIMKLIDRNSDIRLTDISLVKMETAYFIKAYNKKIKKK